MALLHQTTMSLCEHLWVSRMLLKLCSFMHEERLRLSAAWPLLYGLSEKFRQQFAKAFSGLQGDFKVGFCSRCLTPCQAQMCTLFFPSLSVLSSSSLP